MRNPAALAALCLLAACEGNPAATIENASNLNEASASLLIAVRGRGEIAHTADLAGAASCSTVAPNPDRADCVRTFALGTVVSVQARPAPGFKLDHYSGACTGTGACSITMNEKRVLEAIFKATTTTTPPTSQTLLIAVRGRGEVTHTADLAGATACSTLSPNPDKADCTRTYAHNVAVTLQAKAAPGFVFDHWGGPCTGTGACAVTMNEKRAVEAIFKATAVTPTSYTLKILVRGRGEVRHTADLAGATACVAQQSTADRAECARTYAPGAEITLEAVAAGGWRFPGWSGACAAAGTGKCTLKANENRILEVKFEG